MDGYGDAAGYHVLVARGGGGFTWHESAVLRPVGLDVPSWVGYQCVSGDGRFAAVAVLPSSVVNLSAARDRGAFAYSVDLQSGAVRPIASGVGLKYFSPGCGVGDSAVFTLDRGSDDAATELVEADLASGSVTRTTVVSGQVTSAVPVAGGIMGVAGTSLVRVPRSGRLRVIARVGGDAFDLRPAADGGVNFLTTPNSGSSTARAVHFSAGRMVTLASGPRIRMQLFQGRAGRAVLTGANSVDRAAAATAHVRVVDDIGPIATGASLDGGAVLVPPDGAGAATPLVLLAGARRPVARMRPASRSIAVTAVAAYEPPGAAQAGPVNRLGTPAPRGDAAPGTLVAAPARNAPQVERAAQTPTCAVPRLDATRQVMQPSPAQVDWAAQMAEQGLLTGAAYTRSAGWDNLGLPAYAPSSDFPPIPLAHPTGSSWSTVPRSVFDAIMAQESNWSQASWHAPKGMAGDPLVADYYGAAGDIVSIDYAAADCGYGIAQVTTGMRAGDTTYSPHGQIKIAADYQENIAAGLQILESTWNQLYADGILLNNGDPKDLENWFFAAWAYNTGIEPNGSYDPTGCTPGPSCTGPDGTWGLGWANNPENPDYPPNRLPYLKTTYADAAHPGSWPYEERVLGWMGSPIMRYSAPAYAQPTYHSGNTWLQVPPYSTFCTMAGNDCNPSSTNTSNPGAGHCMLNDYECWWHSPVTWIGDCATTCATSSYAVSDGSEPPNPTPDPVTCHLDTSIVPANAIIVDDQPSPNPNLQGCDGSNENWTSNGTFTISYGTNANGDPIGAIDTHQLGSGFGGRVLFSHTEDGSNPNLINTGKWTPTLPRLQYYKIKLHFPALGARATNVVYNIYPGGGAAPWKIRVNQAWDSEQWATIGTFAMQNGGYVTLTNESTSVDPNASGDYTSFDVAWDAVAFVPMGGTPGAPIGGPPTVQDEPKGSNPAFIQCGCAQRTAGDPVDTATGYYGETFTDLATPGRGMPLVFTRTYTEATADPAGPNGSLAIDGPFGYGWTNSYNLTAHTDSSTGAVTITQEDSSRVTFTLSGGTYTPTEPRDDATLAKSGSSYTYTRRGHEIFTFAAATGRLTAQQDLAGAHANPPYSTTLAYDSAGKLSTITDPDNRVYTLTWTGAHITQLKDSAGRTVTYGYDSSGNLTDVYGVGTTRSPSVKNNDHIQYGYNSHHLLTSLRSPKNYGGAATAVTTMTYDTAERVTAQTNPLGHTTRFAYGPSGNPSLSAGQTLVTDPSGHQTLDSYDNGLLTAETRAYDTSLAATTSYTYDPVTLGVTTIVDPMGRTTTYTYDDQGNRTSSSDALGNTTDYAYDATGDLTETIDPAGVATVYLYDQKGHVKTGSGTNAGTYTWGDLTSATVTEANNIVESSTGNFGPAPTRTTNYYYDSPAHPADRTRSVDPLGHTTKLTYDAAGDVATSTDALGHKTVYGWDIKRGWLTHTVTPSGVAAGVTGSCKPPATGCTAYSHDAYGNTTVITDPLGHVTKATYDADGNQLTATDADGNITRTTYDAADEPTKTARADGTVTKISYNSNGTTASTTDAAGHVTRYTYDALGRQTKVTDPDGRAATTHYDADNEPTSTVDAAGHTTTTGYDADGRVTGVTYGSADTPDVTAVGYDPDGRRTTMTDGTGTSTWSYDVFGELIAATDGTGATTGYGYDDAGNQTTIHYPGGGTVTTAYDAANDVHSVTDPGGHGTTFGYSADGLLASTAFPNGVTVTNGYNSADQQTATSVTNSTGTLAAIAYGRDNAVQLASRTPSGAIPGTPTTYGYTKLQQLAAATTSANTDSYGYDKGDNLTANAGITAAYDPADQLCWTTTTPGSGGAGCTSPPTGATNYQYDKDGRRIGSATPGGATTSYSYDRADRLTSVTTPNVSVKYGYNGDGLRTSKTAGDATANYTWADDLLISDGTNQYVYGPGGLPIEQIHAGTPTYLVHDQLGSTVLLLDSAGHVTGGYDYTPWGAIRTRAGTSTTPMGYAGGYTDSETGLIYLRARYYDPTTGLFLTVDPALAATATPYAYAADNPLNRIDPSGLSWWNPVSWSAETWTNVGIGALDVVEEVATDGAATGFIAEEDAALVGLEGGEEAATAVEEARGGVYSLRDEDGTIVRTGRTNDLERRQLEHGRDPVLGQFDFQIEARTDNYFEQRGLEQRLYDENPQARIENGGYNKLRPVSQSNPRLGQYLAAAEAYLESVGSSDSAANELIADLRSGGCHG